MTPPLLELDLLQAFVAVSDQRSFTRAALQLHRTQSAISLQIRRLEDRLQTELFHRTHASVELSAPGEALLGYARRMLALNAEAVDRLAAHGVEGIVRVGVMDDYGTLVLPPVLASFAAAYPRIHVEMETGLTASMPARLGEAYDLVLAMHPAGTGEGEFLRRERAVWAAAPEWSGEAGDALPLALYPPGCLFRKWALEALDAAALPWRIAFVSHSLAAVEAMAAQGLAITVVKSGTFPAKLRPLSRRDGMPDLPSADIRLHKAARLSHAGGLLAEYLRTALARPQDPGLVPAAVTGRGRESSSRSPTASSAG